MKIVIDIPEEEYARIMSMDHFKRTYEHDMICDGTPLQKGHGDLIDRGQALNECYDITIDGDVFTVVQYETLLGVPTIIEAESEGNE